MGVETGKAVLREAKNMVICNWCKQPGKLCRAHLFPEGLKKFLLDDVNGTKSMVRASLDRKKNTSIQTLESDSQILCANCDVKLGYFDQILINFFSEFIRVQNFEELDSWKPVNIPFSNTKNLVSAFLVILYRFSISSRYKEISVGAKYKQLFEAWFENRSIPNNGFESVDIKLFGSSKNEFGLHRMIVNSPEWAKIKGVNIYCFDILGMTVLIKLGKLDWPLPNIDKYPKLGENDGGVLFPLLPYDYDGIRNEKFKNLLKHHRR